MKKWIDNDLSFNEIGHMLNAVQKKDDKKEFYVFVGICVALLAAIIAGIAYLVKRKIDDDVLQEWEEEWEDGEWEDHDCCGCCEDGSNDGLNDEDFDTSVKVEKL